MRVWLLQAKAGEDAGGLEAPLRKWAARPENAAWRVELRPAGPGLVANVRAQPPDVIALAESALPAGAWAEEVLALGPAFVVAAEPGRSGAYFALAERHPVLLVPVNPGPECLGLAALSARAAGARQRGWQTQLEQLQQRLYDRIVIERAKGVLVQRLGIAEEEAYKRLRVQSRRQRRQIRDVAQSLLDAQALLTPEALTNGLAGNGHSHPEEPDHDRRGAGA
jgi:response regulator NasT